jgi:hypothetical protein
MGLILFVLVALLTILLVVVSWSQWHRSRRSPDGAAWRRALGVLALLGTSLQIILFLVFELFTSAQGNADYKRREFPLWAAASLFLFGLVVVAAILGKGRFRLATTAAAAGMVAIWVMLGMAM